ncbi:MAG TPA: hypothetical protein VH113_06970 [Gemmatimonadales bacterium]|jgi:hypothetical protein|nr:hypothetical protein [Gemmatimonadales bacterium]
MTPKLALALTWATLVALPLTTAGAQQDGGNGDEPHPHGRAFSPGNGAGWTFGYPTVDVNAGLYATKTPADSSYHKLFIRLHTALNTGIPHFALSADLNWIPSVSANPVVSFLGQIDPLSRESDLYFSAGAGLITGHAGNRFAGWAQAVVAYRTHIHELAPFIQAGHALNSGPKFEFLFGVAHPLAPYLLHVP